MNQQSNYQLLIDKLDQFIRKYYLNQLIRGGLYSVGLVLGLFLVFNLLEYNFYFSRSGRSFLLYGFLLSALAAIAYWVINPLVRYFKLGPTINHEQASHIIGDHFADVKDKLLNILQLKKQEGSSANQELILASINQKSDAIKLVPFKAAIDLSNNKKYLRYALPPFLMLIVLLFAAPSIITDSTYRILNNDKDFERAAPFSFSLADETLKVVQFEDYELEVTVDGRALPTEAYIEVDRFPYKMTKIDANTYQYTFKNVQKSVDFVFSSGNVRSKPYKLEVLAKPNIVDFEIAVSYPRYTGRKDEKIRNIGDLNIPEGTKLSWSLEADHTDKIFVRFDAKERQALEKKSTTSYFFYKQLRESADYKLYLGSDVLPDLDSIAYQIQVTKDQFPQISMEEFVDSTQRDRLFFAGSASDDYGVQHISFFYEITNAKGKSEGLKSIKIKNGEGKLMDYEYMVDIKKLNLKPGDQLSYYFEVYDNDGVNGSKSTKTEVKQLIKPTIEQLKEQENKNEEAIKDDLQKAIKDLDKIQDKLQKMRDKLLQKKELDWQDKKELEKLLEEQKAIQEKLKEAKKKMDENLKNQEELEQPNEEIQEKQEKLQEMMEKAMDPEKQELMDKIMELMQELEKDDALQMLDQMQKSNEMKTNEMERLKELFKQLEMEKEVNEQIKDLEKLAEKQEELAKETEKQEGANEDQQKKQDEINKELKELEKKQEELEKKNKELSPPKDLGKDNKEQMDDIQKDAQKSKDEMKKGDNKAASKSQKSAAKKMKKMAEKMQESMAGGDQEQAMEDIKTIRQLLENLVKLSFDQERLIQDFGVTAGTTPKYVNLTQQQFKIKDDFAVVEDTLIAMSKRVQQIETFVLDKVTEIKYNLGNTLENLAERRTPEAIEKQRRTMTYLNDLALMLSESMQNMQQQAASSMPGSQMCKKPGGSNSSGNSGKKPLDKITEGQQGLSKELNKMGEKMGKGEKPSAKDFGEAAAKQAALRKALQDLQKEKQEQGKGAGGFKDIIDQMDKIETELVNKKLNNETLKRQMDIVTRLLEAEKAERQRELDEKRKSESGTDKIAAMPPSMKEYLKKRESEVQMYKTVSPALKTYYRGLVDAYYNSLNSK